MKTILLTGATGFLGSHLLEELIKNKYQVIILKHSTSNLWRIEHLLDQVTSYDIDTTSFETTFQKHNIDSVIHTAGCYGRKGESISEIVETNLMFGLQILDCCIKFKVETFINTDTFFNTETSLQKYLNVYTLSKKQFVEWLRQQSNKIQIINLKLEHMYGPKDDPSKFVSWLLSELKSGVQEVKLTSGQQKRDFIYIDDVVSAYMKTLKKVEILPIFSEFDVGTGTLITVKYFVEKLKQAYENLTGESKTILNFGGIPNREGEMMTVKSNNKNLVKLGWSVNTSLEQGLTKLIKNNK